MNVFDYHSFFSLPCVFFLDFFFSFFRFFVFLKKGERVFHPKTPESKASIIVALTKHYLFGKLSEEDKSMIADSMACEPYDKGEKVLTQGDMGDKCYCVEKGQLEIHIKKEDTGTYSKRRCSSCNSR